MEEPLKAPPTPLATEHSAPPLSPSLHHQASPTPKLVHDSKKNSPPLLTLEQESCLKHQLLKLAIQQEVQHFFERPSNIHTTLFLRFMRQRIIDFPLWSKRENAQKMCEELIMSLPELCISSQKATKRDVGNKGLRQVVVKCFDLAMRTPQEKQYDKANTDDEWDLEDDSEDDEQERQRRIKLARALKQSSEIFQRILVEVEHNGGYDHLFKIVKTTPHINNLAPIYQRLGKCISQTLALWVEKEMRDEKQVAKLKRVYTLTPVRAIRATMGLANPVKLMQALLHLFVARPFGSRNLIQKFSEILVELKKTDKLLNEAKKTATEELKCFKASTRKDILKKIPCYVSTNYVVYHNDDEDDDLDAPDEEEALDKLTPRELVTKVLLDDDSKPKIEATDVGALTSQQVQKLHEVILLQMRHKEKEDFVELLGNSRILKIVKELLPVIHEPIARLFNKANVGSHFEVLFKTLKRIIKVTEAREPNQQTRTSMYERVFEKLIRDMYSFLHHIASNDDGTLQETLKWVVEMLAFMDADTLDVTTLVSPSDESKTELRQTLIAELDEVVHYRTALLGIKEEEEERELLAQSENSSGMAAEPAPLPRPERPNLVVLPTLVEDFKRLSAARLRVTGIISQPSRSVIKFEAKSRSSFFSFH